MQTVAVRLHECAERLLRIESIERMQDEDLSRALERGQVLLDHVLRKGQVPGATVHNGRHIRLQQDIERIIPAPDGRFDLLLRHRGDRPCLDGARPHAQQQAQIPDRFGGIEPRQLAETFVGDRLQAVMMGGPQHLQ